MIVVVQVGEEVQHRNVLGVERAVVRRPEAVALRGDLEAWSPRSRCRAAPAAPSPSRRRRRSACRSCRRPTMSKLSIASTLSSGTGLWSTKYAEPSSPSSSPEKFAKMIDRRVGDAREQARELEHRGGARRVVVGAAAHRVRARPDRARRRSTCRGDRSARRSTTYWSAQRGVAARQDGEHVLRRQRRARRRRAPAAARRSAAGSSATSARRPSAAYRRARYAAAESLPGVPVRRPASAGLARYSMSRRIASESGATRRGAAVVDRRAGSATSAATRRAERTGARTTRYVDEADHSRRSRSSAKCRARCVSAP